MDEVPANLKNAAILQLVSGLLNMFIVTPVVYFGIATFCGVLTFFLGGIGGMCGFLGCALWPIGLIEVISGGMTLANPKSGGKMVKYVSYLEVGSILFGGLISAIAGGVVMSMLADDEVTAYLED